MEKIVSDLDRKTWDLLFSYLYRLADGTTTKYSVAIRDWMKFLGSDPALKGSAFVLANATHEQVFDYVEVLKSTGKTQETIRGDISKLKSTYKILMDSGIFRKTPFAILRMKRSNNFPNQKKIVPFELVPKLINTPDSTTIKGARDQAILALFFGGALRPIEVSKIKITDLQVSEGGIRYIHLVDTKNGNSYKQVFPSWAFDKLDQWLEVKGQIKDNEFLFFSLSQNKKFNKLSIQDLNKTFKYYCQILGLVTGYSSYSARATTISKMLHEKMPLRDIQIFARHSSLELLSTYDRRVRELEESLAHSLVF